MRSNDVYVKRHKDTSKLTLERALLEKGDANRKLFRVKELIVQLLHAVDLFLHFSEAGLQSGISTQA